MAAIRQRPHVRLIDSSLRLAIGIQIFVWMLSSAGLHGATSDGQIIVNEGRFGPYYHLRLDLNAEDIDFSQSDRTASSGGQFELRLRPDKFPVPAPHCRGSIILRMPWTSPQAIEAKKKISAKEDLLKRILKLQHSRDAGLSVVIELNPYVEVVSRAPLKTRLTQCNVFFREAFGAYVDHVRPLSPDER
jgi:hypothetical protein